MIDPLRSGYSGKMDANVWRASRYGARETFVKQSASNDGILSAEDIANIKKSYGISTKIPVLDMPTVTIGSVRNCVIQPDQNSSKMIVLTFVSYVWGFTMIPSMYVNNDVKYELDWQKKMRKYLLAVLKLQDVTCLAKINTDRNAVFTNLTYEYPVVGNAFQVPRNSREDVYNQITGIMGTADFSASDYDVIANSGHEPLVNKLARNGTNNADNTLATLNGYNMHYSNSIVNNTGVRDTMYVVPPNTVAMATRNDPDARAGRRIAGAKWGEVDMPMLDITVGTYETEKCADATAIFPTAETAGLTRAAMQGFEFSFDATYVTAYVGDRSANMAPIQKLEIAA